MTSSTERLHARVEGTPVVAERAGESSQGVLCVHGLASRRESLVPLVETLADAGFTAVAPDLRGHGESQGELGLLSRERVLDDLDAWSRRLAEDGVEVRAIVGHSLGGLWALAAQPRLEADALAAVATPVSIRGELTSAEELGYRLGAGLQRLVDPLGVNLHVPYQVDLEDVLDTREAIERARRLELVQRSIPLANASELLALDGEALAAEVTAPAIVAHPVRDELVARDSVRALFEALPEPRRWVELDGPHECFFGENGAASARLIATVLREALAPDEPGL